MPPTAYSHELRILACNHCGAPIDVAVGGGSARCGYCGTVSRIVQRDERADLDEAARAKASTMSESERVQRLRAQDNQPFVPPPSLQPLLAGYGLAPEQRTAATYEWTAARAALQRGGAPFAEAERFFHLTLLLAAEVDDRRRRSLLESAAELLDDKRQRHIVRCKLARQAVLAGDLQAAREWLAPCNPRPLDLRMDTVYRLAQSYLATAEGRPQGVIELLGRRVDDVPIAEGHDSEATVLRADALERTGDHATAGAQLLAYMRADARRMAELRDVAELAGSLGLARASQPAAARAVWAEAERELRAAPTSAAIVVVIVGLIGVGLLFATAWVLATAPWPISCAKNQPGAIAANTGCWGTMATAAAIGTFVFLRQQRRLVRHGVLTFAHVVSATRRAQQGKNSVTIYWDLELDIESGTQRVRKKHSEMREQPVALGAYPCLFRAQEGTFRLKLK